MAQETISSVLSGIQGSHKDNTTGKAALNQLGKVTYRQLGEIFISEGSTFMFEGVDLTDRLFVAVVGAGKSAGLVLDDQNGQSKQLHFGALKRTIMEYDPDSLTIVRDANKRPVMHSAETVAPNETSRCYDKLRTAHSAEEVFRELSAHKGIKLAQISQPINAAVFDGKTVVGTRPQTLGVWVWID